MMMRTTIRRVLTAVAVGTAVILMLMACSSGHHSSHSSTKDSGATNSAAEQKASARVVWSYFDKDATIVTFVVRITNPGAEPLSGISLRARAVDSASMIIGAHTADLPTITGGHLDYVDEIGGAFQDLAGTPAKVTVSVAGDIPSSGQLLPLKTSTLRFQAESPKQAALATPYAYRLSVTVTNSLPVKLGGSPYDVYQQAIAYDLAGNIVGAMAGASDNLPDRLAPGESYVEKADVPATGKATTITYAVWPAN